MKTTMPIGGGMLRCDVTSCPEYFVSYSEARYLRGQALATGWGRAPGVLVDKPGEIKSTTYDLCPAHIGPAKIERARRVADRAEKKKLKVEAQVKKEEAKRERARRAQERRDEKERRRQERERRRAARTRTPEEAIA